MTTATLTPTPAEVGLCRRMAGVRHRPVVVQGGDLPPTRVGGKGRWVDAVSGCHCPGKSRARRAGCRICSLRPDRRILVGEVWLARRRAAALAEGTPDLILADYLEDHGNAEAASILRRPVPPPPLPPRCARPLVCRGDA
jgi:hypothetical protein